MKKSILIYTLTDTGYDLVSMYSFNDKVKVNIYDYIKIDFASFDL